MNSRIFTFPVDLVKVSKFLEACNSTFAVDQLHGRHAYKLAVTHGKLGKIEALVEVIWHGAFNRMDSGDPGDYINVYLMLATPNTGFKYHAISVDSWILPLAEQYGLTPEEIREKLQSKWHSMLIDWAGLVD